MNRISVLILGLAGMAAVSACSQGQSPAPEQKATPAAAAAPAPAPIPPGPKLFVTNEAGGDLTVVDVGTARAVATIPLGKRPRGVRERCVWRLHDANGSGECHHAIPQHL